MYMLSTNLILLLHQQEEWRYIPVNSQQLLSSFKAADERGFEK